VWRPDRAGGWQANRSKVGEGTWGCLRNCFKIRQFLVFLYPEGAGLALSWAGDSLGNEKDEEEAPTEAVGYILF
jgi:hypothetical protein